MMMTLRGPFVAGALFVAFGSTVALASAATVNSRFDAIVVRALNKLDNDFVRGLSAAERRAFNECARNVFAGVPQGRKRYVLAGASPREQEQRLRQISQENRAAVQQQITRECS
jgi:hypothetical protein